MIAKLYYRRNQGKHESFFEATKFLVIFLLLSYSRISLQRMEEFCKARIEKNPFAYLPRTALAGVYLQNMNFEDAIKQYDEIILLGEMLDDDWINYSRALYALTDYSRVIENLMPIIEKYPRHKNANWLLGMSLMRNGNYETATVYLQRLIASGSKRSDDYWGLGYCYDCLGELEKAKDAYFKALSLNPGSSELKDLLTSLDAKLRSNS